MSYFIAKLSLVRDTMGALWGVWNATYDEKINL